VAAANTPDTFFEQLADATDAAPARAPSRLKARTYSALVRAAQREAPLCGLNESKISGRGLCVFEELIQIMPLGEKAQQVNWCGLCHARVLAERVENAPIFWPNCPYVRFQNR
jgi:hypothetical protein